MNDSFLTYSEWCDAIKLAVELYEDAMSERVTDAQFRLKSGRQVYPRDILNLTSMFMIILLRLDEKQQTIPPQ